MTGFHYMNTLTGEVTFNAGEAIDWYHANIPVAVNVKVNGRWIIADTWEV